MPKVLEVQRSPQFYNSSAARAVKQIGTLTSELVLPEKSSHQSAQQLKSTVVALVHRHLVLVSVNYEEEPTERIVNHGEQHFSHMDLQVVLVYRVLTYLNPY